MLFNSVHFIIFFSVVALIYFIIPKRPRIYWLLIASYYFYACWDFTYVLFLLLVTVTTYFSGCVIGKYRDKAKLMLALCIIFNISMLFYFKYWNFTASSINRVIYITGLEWNLPLLDIILPVGISFYIFQAIGYNIDVYRGTILPEKNFINYALFVSFFPQIVSGPIDRKGNLLQQFKVKQKLNYERIRSGLWLVLWGLFQKLVIADRLSIIVDTTYQSPATQSRERLVVATLLYAFQLYCDFNSYSNIARGVAQILGFNLIKNFQNPYFSSSISEFWRRWHISLSSWLRDYVYIPLGGNRKGYMQKYINLMIVFLVSGIWHGAAWTFIIWGILHGAYQVIGSITRKWRDKGWQLFRLDPNKLPVSMLRIVITFVLVDFAWIFFRANNFSDAKLIVNRILFNAPASTKLVYDLKFGQDEIWLAVTLIALLVQFCVSILENRTVRINRNNNDALCLSARFSGWPLILRWGVCLTLLFAILIFGNWETSGFLYFQF